ncbi:PREDICTED: tetraspanin-32 isoform X4 [Bison bison bison]|uniref:Tetraspanin-32 isoform X4 n=1 Tax=Bison bison bison TaxID=43346 RepID=A0A6P3IN97_BISBB|nr:PREDICTED: tetraspanin-32 isoform X4 [Bison bison bison]
MEPCSRVRVAKCQMLAPSLFVLLLGSAMAATAVLSYFGPHFTVIGPVSADRTTYEALHHWAFSAGIALAALLTLGAMLSAAATVRGAGGLMAAAFLSFALVFCALVQAAFWRAHSPTQINRSRWTQARPSSHRKTRAGLPCGTPRARVASTTILGGKSPQLEHGNPCDQHPGDAGPAPGGPGPKEARGGGRLSAAQHLRVVRGSVRDVSFTSTAFPLPCVQMEDAVLDAYDRAYERALRSASGSGRQELVAIQDTGPRPPSPGTQSLQMHPGGIPVSAPVQSRCSWGPSESKQTLGSASAAPGHPPAYPRKRRSYGLDSHVTLVGGEELFPSTWWGVREEEA